MDLYLYPANAGTEAMLIYSRGGAGRTEPPKLRSEGLSPNTLIGRGRVTAGDAHWNLVVVPVNEGLISYYRAWLVFAAVILVFGAVLAYMGASLRHALRLESANSKILELAQTDLLPTLPTAAPSSSG